MPKEPKDPKPKPLTKEEKAKAREEAKAANAAGAAPKLQVVDGKSGEKGKEVPLNGATEPYIEIMTEHLLTPLTADQKLDKLNDLNTTLTAIEDLDKKGKAAASEFKEAAKERRGHLKTIQDQIENGIKVPVKIEVKYDFKAKQVVRSRIDTGELLGTRPMNDYDRTKAQEQLPFQALQKQAEAVTAASGAVTPAEAAPVAPPTPGPSED